MDIRLLGTNWKLQTAEYDAYLKKYIDFSSFACKSNSVQTKIQVLLPSSVFRNYVVRSHQFKNKNNFLNRISTMEHDC